MEDDGWREADDQMGLWENQGQPLTLRWLLAAVNQIAPQFMAGAPDPLLLADPAGDLVIELDLYEGDGHAALTPIHLDAKGDGGGPAALVMTVART